MMLIDLGAGTMRRLLESGRTISEITHVLFTHFHPDHTGEFVSFIFATKYPEIYRRRTPLVVGGGKGIGNFYEGLRNVFDHWIELESGLLKFVEFDTERSDRYEGDWFAVVTLPLNHIASSVGFRIEINNGPVIVCTGDTDVCDNVVTLSEDADVLICEAAFPDEMKIDGHLTPSLAGHIASAARVKHLVLTHFYPECDNVDMGAQCRRTWSGPLLLARDLMELEVDLSGIQVNNQGI
jgi:ribonuclease BN (tRNA processing enzyme)